jgi:maleylpyruvate isomerase
VVSTSHLPENLALLAHETDLLLATAAALDDQSIRVASLCQGWTRAHVLSHLARNADALGNLVSWAVTGTPVAMYESQTSRDGDIAAGSSRSAQEVFTDVVQSAARFASTAPSLAGPPEHVEVEMRQGRKVLGGQLPTLRLLEVVIHHVDLNAGYTFSDTDPGFVKRAISNAVQRLSRSAGVPAVTLRGDNADTWSMGQGTQEVSGTNSALLLWLARGDGNRLRSQQALPELPAWG